jgi:hypothetical protein
MTQQSDTIPEERRIILSENQIDKLTEATLQEVINKLRGGENLAFLALSPDGTIDLTIYGLGTVDHGEGKNERESVFKLTEQMMQVIPKTERTLLFKKERLGLFKSVFTLKASDDSPKIELKKELMDVIADTISKSVALQLKKELFGQGEDENKAENGYEIFLSYSKKDKDEVRKIQQILDRKKISYFLDEKSIDPGVKWENSLRKNLKNCKSFWILVTPNSLKSEWVTTEWATAWALEKPIVPILLRCEVTQLPKRLQDYQTIDFHDINNFILSLSRP